MVPLGNGAPLSRRTPQCFRGPSRTIWIFPPEHRKIVPRRLLGFRSNEPPLVSCRQVIADMIQFRPRPATSTARGTNRNPGSAFLGRASVRAGVPQCLNLKYQVDRLNPQFCILGPKASELLLNA
jgi:hypothetical protein